MMILSFGFFENEKKKKKDKLAYIFRIRQTTLEKAKVKKKCICSIGKSYIKIVKTDSKSALFHLR